MMMTVILPAYRWFFLGFLASWMQETEVRFTVNEHASPPSLFLTFPE
jgi:hypothetical protein